MNRKALSRPPKECNEVQILERHAGKIMKENSWSRPSVFSCDIGAQRSVIDNKKWWTRKGICSAGHLWHTKLDKNHRLNLGMKLFQTNPDLYYLLIDGTFKEMYGSHFDDLIRGRDKTVRQRPRQKAMNVKWRRSPKFLFHSLVSSYKNTRKEALSSTKNITCGNARIFRLTRHSALSVLWQWNWLGLLIQGHNTFLKFRGLHESPKKDSMWQEDRIFED